MSKYAMEKQAFHANCLSSLNAEIARYNPASLLKQASTYPTTHNRQLCAYYLALTKQAAFEKKAFLKAILKALMKPKISLLPAAGLLGAYSYGPSAIKATGSAIGGAADAAVEGTQNLLHRTGRGWQGLWSDPTSDMSSKGINKKVEESPTPKPTGIQLAPKTRWVQVDDDSLSPEQRRRYYPEGANTGFEDYQINPATRGHVPYRRPPTYPGYYSGNH